MSFSFGSKAAQTRPTTNGAPTRTQFFRFGSIPAAAPAASNPLNQMSYHEMLQSNDPKIRRLMRIRRFGVEHGVESGVVVELCPLGVAQDVENDSDENACNGDSEASPMLSREALDEELDRIEAERNAVLKNKPPRFPN